jgi:hypothetical protein
MTRRGARTLVGSLLCLLTFATSAAAECGWVLWEETVIYRPNEGGQRSGTKTFEVKDAHAFKRACDVASQASSDGTLKTLQNGTWSDIAAVQTFERSEPSTFIVIRYEDGSRITRNWLCLPDTIDPRGPKGK